MSESAPWKTIIVSEENAGKRLDVWLRLTVVGMSRQQAKSLLASGEIRLNGRTASKSTTLRVGDRVDILDEPPPALWHPHSEDTIPLNVLYSDADIAAVEKPPGMPSVPLRENEVRTLAGMVVARFPECREVQRTNGDGGLLQRLDRETSGVVLVARTRTIHQQLVEAQRAGRIQKTYLTLVHSPNGPPPPVIDTPLGGAGPRGSRMVPNQKGLPARTTVEPIEFFQDWTLVRATIHKGVRHQIRAHLASAEAPIAGDRLYGSTGAGPQFPRLFLHAHRIQLAHPTDNARLVIHSPLPADLAVILKNLRR